MSEGDDCLAKQSVRLSNAFPDFPYVKIIYVCVCACVYFCECECVVCVSVRMYS